MATVHRIRVEDVPNTYIINSSTVRVTLDDDWWVVDLTSDGVYLSTNKQKRVGDLLFGITDEVYYLSQITLDGEVKKMTTWTDAKPVEIGGIRIFPKGVASVTNYGCHVTNKF